MEVLAGLAVAVKKGVALLALASLIAGAFALIRPDRAEAHCDSVGGPVVTAARRALETGNVKLILPYVPAEAEAELTAAFRQAMEVRQYGGKARELADRYFFETAVRLHRATTRTPGQRAPGPRATPTSTEPCRGQPAPAGP